MKYPTAVAASVLVLCAAGAASAADACFRTNDMKNHTIVDDHTLYVGVGNSEVWRIGVAGNCLSGAHNTDALVLKTTGSSGLVCKPLDIDLAVKRGTIPSACIVDKVSKLTPEEVAAIPKGLKP